MGWSDKEFWEASPRKYWAVLYTHIDINRMPSTKPKLLKGDDAIRSLRGLIGT